MSELRNRLRNVPGLVTASRFVKTTSHAMRVGLRAPLSQFVTACPPGSFYSPLPAPEDIPSDVPKGPAEIAGVDLREAAQLALLDDLARSYADVPFTSAPVPERRYHLDNEYYSYCDAVVLFAMMRHYRPRRIVEIGSGFSSAVMLDTRDLFLELAQTHLTFIDPNPERLESLLRPEDRGRCDVLPRKVQEVALRIFDALEPNDILFVDSSHVVKLGSDVAWIVFEILPRIAPGVVVHFHDIPWPFEYPVSWLKEGRAWNEAYFLRSFLQYNDRFQILFFNDFMASVHAEAMRDRMPLAMKESSTRLVLAASSLWLSKR